MLENNRLAAVSVSFGWIFMIIIGSFFILLSYNVIDNYRENKEAQHSIEMRNILRNVFNEFGRTSGIEQNKIANLGNMFRDSSVRILCEEGFSIMEIDGELDSNSEYLNIYPVFMTNIEQGNNQESYMILENFKMPFKITGLFALVSKKNLIVIDIDSELGKKLNTKFKKQSSFDQLNIVPLKFSTGFNNFESSYVEDNNLNSVIFVTDDEDWSYDISNLDMEAYIIKVKEESTGVNGGSYGVITYIDKNKKEYKFNYYDYDDSLVLPTMAVFSNPNVFNCSFNKLIDLTEISYNFYIQKANYYINTQDLVCVDSVSLDDQKVQFSNINQSLTEVVESIKTDKFIKLENIDINIKTLDDINLRLEDRSCPAIY